MKPDSMHNYAKALKFSYQLMANKNAKIIVSLECILPFLPGESNSLIMMKKLVLAFINSCSSQNKRYKYTNTAIFEGLWSA